VHLCDRGGRQRRVFPLCEHLFGRRAEVLRQLFAQRFDRHWRRATVQLLELGDPLGSEQVGAAREDLAELDESRAEFLECAPQLLGRRQAREFGGVIDVQRMAGLGQRVGPAEPVHHVAESMAHEHRRDVLQAAEIARVEQGLQRGHCIGCAS
jgi:hypothetical protein